MDKEMWHIYTMEAYSVMQKEKSCRLHENGRNEIIMLSKIARHRKLRIPCFFLYSMEEGREGGRKRREQEGRKDTNREERAHREREGEGGCRE